MREQEFRRMLAWLAVGAVLVAAAGCGGGGSSSTGGGSSGNGGAGSSGTQPAYCADRATLNTAVDGLTVPTSSDQLADLQAQLTTIQSDTTALVDSAKSDFPSETSAISSAVDTLSADVNALPESPTTAQIAAVAADVTGVVGAVKTFSDASSAKCG